MALGRNPVQMGWSLRGRPKRRRDNVMRIFMLLWEIQSPSVSCPFSSIIRQLLLFLRYQILFKQCVGTEDVFFGMSRKDPSTACCEDMVVSWTCISSPFFVLCLCPFQSCCLLEGQNITVELYCWLWPPVGFSFSSSRICRWYLHLLTWGTHVSPQWPHVHKRICANAHATYNLREIKSSSTEHWNRLPREVVEFPFSGGIQDPPGWGPVQPALGDPALAVGLD